jgi:hypothetical protein
VKGVVSALVAFAIAIIAALVMIILRAKFDWED